jgi:hypothetical protein
LFAVEVGGRHGTRSERRKRRTEVTAGESRPLVRPFFRKLALAAFIALAPVVGLAAWDYVEARRLNDAISDIRAAGQPVTLRERRQPAGGGGLPAERYYRAAAAIAEVLGHRDGLLDATRIADWSADVVQRIRGYVNDRREALVLLDRAAALPFEPVQRDAAPGSGLFDLARLAGFRSMLAIIDGNATAAIESIDAELRLWRVISDAASPARLSVLAVMERLGAAVNRTHPPASLLARLAPVLEAADRDDRLKTSFIAMRAGFLDQGLSTQVVYEWRINGIPALWGLAVFEPVRRPFFERFVANRVERLTEAIRMLDQPWPGRGRAAAAIYARVPPNDPLSGFQTADVAISNRIVIDLALVRSARMMVAIESFRHDHGGERPERADDLVPAYLSSLPVDPYSGGHLLIHDEATSYAVYSAGSNGRDDGGDFGSSRFVDGTPEPRDLGVRVQTR